MIKNFKIAIIGLGYVGLPLAVQFAKKYDVIGFDVNHKRISQLRKGLDKTNELSNSDIINVSNSLTFTSNDSDLKFANFYIVTVPTPINQRKQPDLTSIKSVSKMLGGVLKKGDFVVFESTVYPGVTRDICVPIIEKISKMSLNKDFYVGYSPERINPGDKKHKVSDIVKVVSGSNKFSLNIISKIYTSVITAGIHRASSIEVAEAAKVIENTQRDLNIALANELSIIFNKIGIDTKEVIEAASTKWNFSPYYPGLVGGHCIGVDPYYLTYKSKQVGHNPRVILSGRSLNDNMPRQIISSLTKALKLKDKPILNSRILILGYTFKENCPDIRNTKVHDVVKILQKKNADITLFDPLINKSDLKDIFKNILITRLPKKSFFDAVLLCVPHDEFKKMGSKRIRSFLSTDGIFFDVKSLFKKNESDLRL
ncbi:MAG: Vi polysaccharide biosynthesis protein VipA/TviB [Euryarchaeota archaeon]|nr:Vi polysaccharide biosynthesis protein VipA/TviB [Euryarchaeota archaeon]